MARRGRWWSSNRIPKYSPRPHLGTCGHAQNQLEMGALMYWEGKTATVLDTSFPQFYFCLHYVYLILVNDQIRTSVTFLVKTGWNHWQSRHTRQDLQSSRLSLRCHPTPIDVSKRSLSKAQRNQEQGWSSKQTGCWCHALVFLTNETKRFHYLYNSTGWKAVCGEEAFWLQIVVRNWHGTSAVKQDNISWLLITKIKLMPGGNFAKCTIYLNATFRLSLGIQKLPVSARNKKAISKLKIILFLNQ